MGGAVEQREPIVQSLKTASFYERNRKYLSRGLWHLLAIILVVLVLLPIYWMIAVSLKEPATVSRYPVEFWPAKPLWANYLEVWRRANVPRYMFNSVYLSTVYTILCVWFSALAGYGFSRFRVGIKKPLFTIVMATMIMPPMIFTIPHFLMFYKLKLLNSYWPWVFYGLAGSSFHIFLFRQFFSSIPLELEDAAALDGCSPFGTFLRIIVPNSQTAFAAGAIFAFQWTWSDYLLPRLFLQEAKFTMSVALSIGLHPPFRPDYAKDFPVELAGAVYYVLPLALIFFLAQKFIIKGVITTGLKG